MSPQAITLLALALFGAGALLQGCGGGGGDKPASGSNIADIASKTETLSKLVEALKAADLVATLGGKGPFTVFAPTNDAFNALSYNGSELRYLLNNKDKLTEVLEYHVTTGNITSGDLKNGEKVKMLMGGDVTVTIANRTVMINDATVTTPNVIASNGVVHVINKVLIPENFTAPKIPELAVAANLTTLVKAVTAANLATALAGGPLTVFAPTNKAFADLPAGVLEKLLEPANLKDLQQVLKYHVHSGEVVSSDLKNGQKVSTLEGSELNVTISGVEVQINKAKVIKADQFAVNGVVHVIDAVLLPPATVTSHIHIAPMVPPSSTADKSMNIVQLAKHNADLSTLVTALKKGKLAHVLGGVGPFTVFAPTNEAFAKLPKATLSSLLEPKNIKDLDAILEYHVISGAAVFKADLKSDQKVKTVESQDVEIQKRGNDVLINNQARVTTADVAASNGVVHIIDSVLMLPKAAQKQNIVQLAEHTSNLSILVSALVAGDLVDTLSSAGKFTVFAPTDEAFKALPASTLQTLMKPENKAELVNILKYHVLPEEVLSTQLKPFQAVKTVEGKFLHVQEWGGKVCVGPSLISKDLKNVVKADNLASNGVVHIIDGVLLPPASSVLVV